MTVALDDRRQARLGLIQICLAGVLWGTGGLGMQAVSYTHLTLPTNREV